MLSSLNQEIRLLRIFNDTSIENYYSMRLFIAKGNSPPTAGGQRWEAQRAAEQCLETGGMMFERSEFLPPQALRQAATDEVRTDRRILQQRMLMQFVSKGSTECRTQLPMFLVLFSKKYREKELKKNTSGQLRLGTAVEFDGERKRVFCPPTFASEPRTIHLQNSRFFTYVQNDKFAILVNVYWRPTLLPRMFFPVPVSLCVT